MSTLVAADIFAGLAPAEREDLERRLRPRRFAAGAIVLQQGGLSGELHIVRSGTLEVRAADQRGRSTTLALMGPNQCCGEMSLLTGQPHSATVVAATAAETLVLSRDDFFALMERSAQLAQNLSRVLSQRLYRATRQQAAATRATVVALACPHLPRAAPILGVNLAISLARQTRRPVLFVVDGATLEGALSPLAAAALPSLDEVARDAAAGAAHRAAPRGHRALRGAQLCTLRRAGEEGVADPRWHDEIADSYGYVILAPALAGVEESWALGAERAIVAVPHGRVADTRVSRAIGSLSNTGAKVELVATDLAQPPTVTELADLGARSGVRALCGLPFRLEALADDPLPPLVRRERGKGAANGIDWLAREIAGLKVGLALGAGSARGFAHIGALRVLERSGVPIDILTGTSIGAVVAAGVACGHSADHVGTLMSTFGPRVLSATIPYRSLFGNRALRLALRRMTGERLIEDLRLPFAAVAVDLTTQEPVDLGRGLLWEAVLASAAVPGIFPPVRRDGRLLIDGVVREPLPTRTAAALGADVTIGVRLSPSRTGDAVGQAEPPRATLVDILLSMVDTMQESIESHGSRDAHLIIHPVVSKVTLRNFEAGEALIAAGEAATEELLPALGKHLPWLRDDLD